MEPLGISSFFFAGLVLGAMHAFDPDHLAAVGGMSSGQKKSVWRQAFHWSIGHGGVILVIAALVFLFGRAVPEELSAFAESCVGLVLILIGIVAFINCYRFYTDNSEPLSIGSRKLGAPFVGMLHGTAGSAPLLAIVPLSGINEPTIGLVYVTLFCLGVSVTMAGLGGLLGLISSRLEFTSKYFQLILQIFLASFASFFGAYLLLAS